MPARAAPRPTGESQRGSPGFAAFQSAKSSGSRLASPGSTRAPASRSSRLRFARACRSRGTCGPRSRRRRCRRRRRTPCATSSLDERDDLAGRARRPSAPRRGAGSRGRPCPRGRRRAKRAASATGSSPRSLARLMILSSTSVKLRTYFTRVAARAQVADDHVPDDVAAGVADVRRSRRRSGRRRRGRSSRARAATSSRFCAVRVSWRTMGIASVRSVDEALHERAQVHRERGGRGSPSRRPGATSSAGARRRAGPAQALAERRAAAPHRGDHLRVVAAGARRQQPPLEDRRPAAAWPIDEQVGAGEPPDGARAARSGPR